MRSCVTRRRPQFLVASLARCPRQAKACPVGRQRRAVAAASAAAADAAVRFLLVLLYIRMGDNNLNKKYFRL